MPTPPVLGAETPPPVRIVTKSKYLKLFNHLNSLSKNPVIPMFSVIQLLADIDVDGENFASGVYKIGSQS